ncbi:probable UDP-sugar transporter protein SLC35A4 isoform X3 [Haliotis rufescens]|uniref:probable UDP-sugar transporter protein SLC35A4 isoform X3 n=1 Tax=Haliotis rufescens TaxID=6454 RepID=UPI00201EC571|nr:probable UDP-sugar transporter protein SLC35A4 isoform X3 [Haliotis rufescens]
MAQESKKVESVCVSFISDDKHVFRLLLWGILLVTEVFIYSSYTILAHLCLVDGKLPFRSSSVVFSTEVLKPCCTVSTTTSVFTCRFRWTPPPTRKLSGVQWISLGVLSISGILDSYGGMQNKASVWSGEIHLTVTGLLMMCAYCWISGLAGVYTEYILKKQYETSLHVQNTLLYTFGIVLNGGVWAVQEAVSGKEGERRLNLFEGFTFKTWAIVVSLAFNGLIMSAIMKHGSNITRLFIISCAMLVTTLLSVAIFQLALNMYYILAFILVVVALYMYHR